MFSFGRLYRSDIGKSYQQITCILKCRRITTKYFSTAGRYLEQNHSYYDKSCELNDESEPSREKFGDESDVFGSLKFRFKEPSQLKKSKTELEKNSNKEKQIYRNSRKMGVRHKIKFPQRERKVINTADEFGTLASDGKYFSSEILTDEYVKEEERDNTVVQMKYPGDRPSAKMYTEDMKRLIADGKLKNALQLYEVKMLKEDRVKPTPYTYSVLINGCGAAGYTKKAFSLYKQLRGRGMKPSPATITGLFVACSNSPFKEDALKRAQRLREVIKEKGWSLNLTHYHSMIQAFGKCGDMASAFEIVDGLVEEGFAIRSATISFLLMACISDSRDGLKFAILVWRKMLSKNISPNIYAYNLLLRCIKCCGIGDIDRANKVLLNFRRVDGMTTNNADEKNSQHGKIQISTDSDHVDFNSLATNGNYLISTAITADKVPDLLSPVSKTTTDVSLQKLETPQDRLMLFGGMPGFLSRMVRDKVKPNIKTFTQLLDVITLSTASESLLLQALEDHNVEPDIDFCNMLMKRRACRHDDRAANAVFEVIQKYGLSPNIMTFGILAMTCRTFDKTTKLVEDMESSGLQLNVEIINTLLGNAVKSKNFWLVMKMMNILKKNEIKPDSKTLEHLENIVEHSKTDIEIKKDKGYNQFMMHYKGWLTEMPVDLPQHPWKQYEYKINVSDDST